MASRARSNFWTALGQGLGDLSDQHRADKRLEILDARDAEDRAIRAAALDHQLATQKYNMRRDLQDEFGDFGEAPGAIDTFESMDGIDLPPEPRALGPMVDSSMMEPPSFGEASFKPDPADDKGWSPPEPGRPQVLDTDSIIGRMKLSEGREYSTFDTPFGERAHVETSSSIARRKATEIRDAAMAKARETSTATSSALRLNHPDMSQEEADRRGASAGAGVPDDLWLPEPTQTGSMDGFDFANTPAGKAEALDWSRNVAASNRDPNAGTGGADSTILSRDPEWVNIQAAMAEIARAEAQRMTPHWRTGATEPDVLGPLSESEKDVIARNHNYASNADLLAAQRVKTGQPGPTGRTPAEMRRNQGSPADIQRAFGGGRPLPEPVGRSATVPAGRATGAGPAAADTMSDAEAAALRTQWQGVPGAEAQLRAQGATDSEIRKILGTP